MITVLLFGESENDRRSIENIIRSATKARTDIRIIRHSKPLILRMDANHKKRQDMSNETASFARAHQKVKSSGQVIVVSHRDCDEIEPAHKLNSKNIEDELLKAGVNNPVAATPAWEIETWWMLFPEALAKARPSWKRVDYSNRQIGSIPNSKDQLRHDLRPDDPSLRARCKDYREEDSIKISQYIRSDFALPVQRLDKCGSMKLFIESLLSAMRKNAL